MAIMKRKEMKKLDAKDINKKLDEFRLELAKERAKIDVGANVTSPGRIREMRKTIARMLTIQKENSKTGEKSNE